MVGVIQPEDAAGDHFSNSSIIRRFTSLAYDCPKLLRKHTQWKRRTGMTIGGKQSKKRWRTIVAFDTLDQENQILIGYQFR
jgi:hypothetical protein